MCCHGLAEHGTKWTGQYKEPRRLEGVAGCPVLVQDMQLGLLLQCQLSLLLMCQLSMLSDAHSTQTIAEGCLSLLKGHTTCTGSVNALGS